MGVDGSKSNSWGQAREIQEEHRTNRLELQSVAEIGRVASQAPLDVGDQPASQLSRIVKSIRLLFFLLASFCGVAPVKTVQCPIQLFLSCRHAQLVAEFVIRHMPSDVGQHVDVLCGALLRAKQQPDETRGRPVCRP